MRVDHITTESSHFVHETGAVDGFLVIQAGSGVPGGFGFWGAVPGGCGFQCAVPGDCGFQRAVADLTWGPLDLTLDRAKKGRS
jgi:hypothetical protein